MEYKIGLKIGDPSYKNGVQVDIQLDELPAPDIVLTINDAIAVLNDTLKPLIIGDEDA